MKTEKNSSKAELAKLVKELKAAANKPQAAHLQRFFKTGPGQYGAGDVFLGIKVPHQRLLARKYTNLGLAEIKQLLASPFHEFRLVGLLFLVDQYEKARKDKNRARQQSIVEFYLENTDRINNWDLVDLSVYKILGDYLLDHKAPRKILDKLVTSKNMWERRMAMVGSYAFIRAGRVDETLRLAEKLLKDENDLIHKAVGWMLREVGKRADEQELTGFLDKHYQSMPRTALRYAIERLSPRQREHYLS